jgi:hypothetical protein
MLTGNSFSENELAKELNLLANEGTGSLNQKYFGSIGYFIDAFMFDGFLYFLITSSSLTSMGSPNSIETFVIANPHNSDPEIACHFRSGYIVVNN